MEFEIALNSRLSQHVLSTAIEGRGMQDQRKRISLQSGFVFDVFSFRSSFFSNNSCPFHYREL